MNTEWLKLRPYSGDQNHAFEELVCQLARAEVIPGKQSFTRIEAPDAGVEAYCRLDNGEEYGWQAKFFSEMKETQWKQLDKSFQTVLDKRPNLVRYFVSLPLDRQDPKIPGQQWFMDKWVARTVKWTAAAKKLGRSITFEYWGNSEIFDRLSRAEHHGRQYYWFNKDELSDQWFSQQLEASILTLGPRYTPALNFQLPLANIFNGLAKDLVFKDHFIEQVNMLINAFREGISYNAPLTGPQSTSEIISIMDQLIQYCRGIDFSSNGNIDVPQLRKWLDDCEKSAKTIRHDLQDQDRAAKKEKTEREYVDGKQKRDFQYEVQKIREFEKKIDGFLSFIYDTEVSLSNTPALLLAGEAGVGKSHLLADVAKKRNDAGHSSLLLLGQRFTKQEPWAQILQQLHLPCGRDIFLAALDARGEAIGSRVMIMIDAINEGEGRALWKNYLADIISAIVRYPYIGLVLSVRSTYEKIIVPEQLITDKRLVRIEHRGFGESTYEASKLFFDYYQIKQPAIPLLHPEFTNPLFLKLFCEGLQKRRLHSIPEGYSGLTAIIDFYLDTLNRVISEKHDIPVELETVQTATKSILIRMAAEDGNRLPSRDLHLFVAGLPETQAIPSRARLLQDLIAEGLFSVSVDSDGNDVIYFTYERFGDHLMAAYLLDTHLDLAAPEKCFEKGGALHPYLADDIATLQHRGLIDAFSIQLPERIGRELFELAPTAQAFDAVASGLIQSILWRRKETLERKLLKYINEIAIKRCGLKDQFLETLMLVTSIPGHLFNSDFVHEHLYKMTMPDRDAWWLRQIMYQYPCHSGEISGIQKMIDWAWGDDPRPTVSDEAIRLMAQTMCWFLASNNRVLRDCTTKALIALLSYRISVLISILKTFAAVNDLYIRQRVYAVAYGCATRSSDLPALTALGNVVFENVFDTDEVYPDFLLRNYARQTIEIAVQRGQHFTFDLQRIRPPYKSDLPSKLPTQADIKKYLLDPKSPGFGEHKHAQNEIIDSMKTNVRGQMYGDFGRYVFQGAIEEWKGADVQGLSNLCVQWIFERYGYDVEKHGPGDRGNDRHRYDRQYIKEERIGKKYQWIAFHEILARVSDNYILLDDSWPTKKEIPYDGPWHPDVLDIDPTIIVSRGNLQPEAKCWWAIGKYDNWKGGEKAWLEQNKDLPDPRHMIQVTDPDGTEWLALETQASWAQPTSIGDAKYSRQKELWYQVRSYITPKDQHSEIVKWAAKQNFYGRWMPEGKDRYAVFSREYFWSAACSYFRQHNASEYRMSLLEDKKTDQEIGSVFTTTFTYSWDNQYDHSKRENPISFHKPTEIIFKLLNLQYGPREGELVNSQGEVVCFDPWLIRDRPACLLVRKKDFLKALDENGYEIFWTVLGEKSVPEAEDSRRRARLRNITISGAAYFLKDKLQYKPKFFKD